MSFFFLPGRKIFLKTWTFQVHFQPDSRIQHELFRSKKIRRRRRRKICWPFSQWKNMVYLSKLNFSGPFSKSNLNFWGHLRLSNLNFSGPPKRCFFPRSKNKKNKWRLSENCTPEKGIFHWNCHFCTENAHFCTENVIFTLKITIFALKMTIFTLKLPFLHWKWPFLHWKCHFYTENDHFCTENDHFCTENDHFCTENAIFTLKWVCRATSTGWWRLHTSMEATTRLQGYINVVEATHVDRRLQRVCRASLRRDCVPPPAFAALEEPRPRQSLLEGGTFRSFRQFVHYWCHRHTFWRWHQ